MSLLADKYQFKEYLQEYEQDKFSEDMEHIVIDYENLRLWNEEVAADILEKPDAYLEQLKFATSNFLQKEIDVLIKNSPKIVSLQKLKSLHLGKLISVTGIVSKSVPPRPMIVRAAYQCRDCPEIEYPTQNEWVLVPPSKCSSCGGKRFRLLEDPTQTLYIDVQTMCIQEKPEDLEVGQPPRLVDLEITRQSLINIVQAGDIVKIVGIPKTRPPPKAKNRKWKTYIEVVSIEKQNEDPSSVKINEEDEQTIQWLASDKSIFEKLVKSVAPSIYGYERIKEAVIYQLFGGVEKKFGDRTARGNIHLLWIDDPSTAKSQVLLAAKNISARGLYVSGGGASGAGLTAAVIKTEDTWTLEAGAMVLANGGICCIDEIEKMNDEDRKRIHEAMSIQTVNIQKATVHYTLPAKTAILAAGNPAFGRYDNYRTVAENVSLPPSILSRFDLVFIGRGDKSNKERDEAIATHVLDNPNMFDVEISKELLRKYIAYARRINPIMSDKAKAHIKAFYIKMRSMYEGVKDVQATPIVITARQLEGLRRLSEAHARIRLSETVEEEDAFAAISLMLVSLQQAGIDPKTGQYDIDAVMGTPKTVRAKMTTIMDMFKEKRIIEREEMYERMEKLGVSKQETANAIHKLINDGILYEQGIGIYGMVRRS